MRTPKVVLLLDADAHRQSLRRLVLTTKGLRVISARTPKWAMERIVKGGIDMLMVNDSIVGVSPIKSKDDSFEMLAKVRDGLSHARSMPSIERSA